MESDDTSVSEPDNDAKFNADNSPTSQPQAGELHPNVDKSMKTQIELILSSTKFDKIGEKEKLGLLARVKGKLSRGKALWVSKIGRVWVRLETDRDAMDDCVKMMRDREHDVFVGEPLPEKQLWCVDGQDGDASR